MEAIAVISPFNLANDCHYYSAKEGAQLCRVIQDNAPSTARRFCFFFVVSRLVPLALYAYL